MMCDICGKNEATIHSEEITEKGSVKIHLCADCLAKNPMTGALAFSALIFLGGEKKSNPGAKDETSSPPPASCSSCGWDSTQLKHTGRMGCPECYDSFREIIEPALTTMHHGVRHTGKRPLGQEISENDELRMRMATLRHELGSCVKEENYEQAAVLRDRIAELEKKLSPEEDGNER